MWRSGRIVGYFYNNWSLELVGELVLSLWLAAGCVAWAGTFTYVWIENSPNPTAMCGLLGLILVGVGGALMSLVAPWSEELLEWFFAATALPVSFVWFGALPLVAVLEVVFDW